MKYIYSFVVATLLCAQSSLWAQSIDLPVFDHPTRHELDLQGKDELVIRLKGLSPNEEYTVYLPQDHSRPILTTGNLPTGTTSHDATMISGVATEAYVEFCLNVAVKSVPTFRIFVEKGERYQPGGALKAAGDTIETEGTLDLDFMLNTIFRKDSCFELTPTSIISEQRSVIGDEVLHQTGIFRNGLPTVGIDSGLIISTGWVENAPGPNFFSSSQSGLIDIFDMNGVDPDAASLVPPGIDVYDIAVLEFDFIPTTDTISFNYVFFSEQYCASGAGVTNDAFGFLLTGPDGVTRNIARLPISGDVVSPATLNPESVDAASFLNNTTADFDDPCVDTPPPPERLRGIAYDGFSTVLQAKGAVVPCAPHSMKIIVVDAGDFILDSGILLEAGSFLAGLVNKPEPNTTAQIDVLQPVEGCDTATIRFTRRTIEEPFINTPLPVKYNVVPYFGAETEAVRATDPANTAGADYLLPESPFIIPAGDTSAVLQIPILNDADFNEGLEAFIVRYDGTCDCTENADTFWIQDNVAFDVELGPDLMACAGAELDLIANPLGGNGVYTYSWPDPNLTDQTVTYVSTGRDTSIIVNVTDGCGLNGTDTVFIAAPAISATTPNAFFSLCSTPTAAVAIDLEGSSFYDLTIEIDSSGQRDTITYRVSGDTTLSYNFSADVTILSVTDLSGCGGSATGTATIRGPEVNLTAAVVPATCGQSIGAIDLTALTGNGNFTFEWLDDAAETTATRTALPPGNYTVVIAPLVDPTCTDTFRYELAMPPVVQIDAFDFTAPSCAGETLVLAPVVSGGTPPYTFNWPDSTSTDSLLTVVTQTGRTIYPFEVTDSCGFTDRDTVVFDLPAFSVELSGRFSLCNQNVVNVPLFVDGPADSYTISLTIDSAGTQVQRTLMTSGGGLILPIDFPASLTINGITNGAGCPGDTITGFATVVDPMINFSPIVENIRCTGESSGSIALLNASPLPVNYTWGDTPDNTGVRTGLAAGTYNLTISDAADPTCFRDTSFVLIEPEPFALALSSGSVTCPFENDTLVPVITGGTPPYVFSWPDSMATDSLLPIITQQGFNTYTVIVTDACGITLSDSVSFNLSDTRAEVSGNYSVCNTPNVDVPIILTGTGPFTFVIRENGADRTLTATTDTLLNYSEATTVQLVSVIGADNCPGAAGGIANVSDGTFNLVVDQTNVLCHGATTGAISIVVNGDNSMFDFTWTQAGLTGPAVSGLSSATYNLRITDRTPAACTFDTTFNILQPASPITLVSDSLRNETCRSLAFASANYIGGTGQLSYSWSNGTTGNVLGEVPAGIYTLSVTDENNCDVTQTFDLQDQKSTVLAAISANVPELSCNQLSMDLSAAQNTQAVDYAWTDSNGTLLGTARGLTVTTPGRYLVMITNPANGCSAVDSIDVRQSDDVLNLQLPVTHALNCNVTSVDLTVAHPDFTGVVNYEWVLNGNIVSTDATLANISTTGTYEVTAIRADNGCQSVARTEVIIDRTPPTTNVPEPTITSNCRAPEVTLGITAAGPVTFAWSTTNGNLTGGTNQALATADRAGTYNVIVTDTINGCTTTETLTVVLDGETLDVNAGTDQTLVCTGLGTLLNGSFSPNLGGQTEMIWFDPEGNEIGMGTQVLTTVAGPHVLEVIHPVSGCSSFDTVRVIDNAPTGVTYTLQQPPCPEVGGRLFVNTVTGLNGPFDYSSPTGMTEPFGGGLRGLRVGTNVLVVTDQLGCELRDTFQIFDGEGFTGNAPDVTINLGNEATLGVSTNRNEGQITSWEWGNLNDSLACLNCPDPQTSPLESFVATVTIIDTNGCELLLRQNVIVDEGDLIYMPTAFSPANGDGVNDVYMVFGNPEFVNGINYLQIYDRWGSRVFSQENFSVNDPNAGWDGKALDGRLAPNAVYAYVVSYERFDGISEIKKGGFTLVR